jgi:hypothetical protein
LTQLPHRDKNPKASVVPCWPLIGLASRSSSWESVSGWRADFGFCRAEYSGWFLNRRPGPAYRGGLLLPGEDSAVNRNANRFRDRNSALIKGSVCVAPVREPCTCPRSRLSVAVKFSKDLARDASIVAVGTVIRHLCNEQFALAPGLRDIHHSWNMVADRNRSCWWRQIAVALYSGCLHLSRGFQKAAERLRGTPRIQRHPIARMESSH